VTFSKILTELGSVVAVDMIEYGLCVVVVVLGAPRPGQQTI